MYGFNNLSRAGFVGTLLGGTPMEYISPKQYELFNVAKYMFEAACYKGQGFMGFNGRGTAGTEFGCGVSIMNGVLPFIGLFHLACFQSHKRSGGIEKLICRRVFFAIGFSAGPYKYPDQRITLILIVSSREASFSTEESDT